MKKCIRYTAILTALCSLFAVATASAAAIDAGQITAAGNGRGAPPCASCHGKAGEGDPTDGIPRLAGLPSAYLQRQLKNFANGRRQNPKMAPIAKALSSDEIRALTRYYAELPAQAMGVTPADTSDTTGRLLAERGLWLKGVPACSRCHGDDGSGIGEDFPALAGQSSIYLVNQLKAWQDGTRDPGPMELMGGIAKRLSDTDVRAVADYFSRLPPRSPEAKP